LLPPFVGVKDRDFALNVRHPLRYLRRVSSSVGKRIAFIETIKSSWIDQPMTGLISKRVVRHCQILQTARFVMAS
jgi:hypothetical protein